MGGAGIVADRERGHPCQCGERRKIGAADEVEAIGADVADRAGDRLFAGNPSHDGQQPSPVQSARQLAVIGRGPTLFGPVRRRSWDQHREVPAGNDFRQGPDRGQPRRCRRGIDPGHQQLLGLPVHRVLPVALEVGVGMGAAGNDPRPFRHRPRPKQPGIERGAVGGLEIIDPIEAALPQHAAQREQALEDRARAAAGRSKCRRTAPSAPRNRHRALS